jgi:hypothetical protein
MIILLIDNASYLACQRLLTIPHGMRLCLDLGRNLPRFAQTVFHPCRAGLGIIQSQIYTSVLLRSSFPQLSPRLAKEVVAVFPNVVRASIVAQALAIYVLSVAVAPGLSSKVTGLHKCSSNEYVRYPVFLQVPTLLIASTT